MSSSMNAEHSERISSCSDVRTRVIDLGDKLVICTTSSNVLIPVLIFLLFRMDFTARSPSDNPARTIVRDITSDTVQVFAFAGRAVNGPPKPPPQQDRGSNGSSERDRQPRGRRPADPRWPPATC